MNDVNNTCIHLNHEKLIENLPPMQMQFQPKKQTMKTIRLHVVTCVNNFEKSSSITSLETSLSGVESSEETPTSDT